MKEDKGHVGRGRLAVRAGLRAESGMWVGGW